MQRLFNLPTSQLNEGWYLSKLRYESEDVIVELIWQNQQLTLIVETNKAVIEEQYETIEQAQKKLTDLLGKNRWENILNNWHEISYRKTNN